VKKLLAALVVLLLLGGGAVAAYVLVKREQSKDVRGSPTVEFTPTETTPRVPPELREVQWPMYGFDKSRVRAVDGLGLRPPFRRLWRAGGRSLLEFPPAIAYGRLYLVNNGGVVQAFSTRTGKRAWAFRSGRCVAASPAVTSFAHGTVFAVFLNRPPCNADRDDLDGEVIAFSAGFGKVRWRTRIGPTESSPLVANGFVYVGDWRGKVYALDERTGRIRWSFETDGKIKGAVALSGNTLVAGSYDHHVYALDARTGRLRWKAAAQARLGPRGTFYSTPAIAYGRVYIGSTDGKVYSFGTRSGELRWSHGTGGYVYASPAVWRKLVLVGSYDRNFYALDAATGDERWRFRANGQISGSATVLDGVVYFATLEGRTYALDAATGKQLWTFPDGKYTPVVADRERLYLLGYAQLYGMVERG
jgi:outer membrane protein assembly factor BamB